MKKSNTELVNEIVKTIPSRKAKGEAHWCVDGRKYNRSRRFYTTKNEAIKEAEKIIETKDADEQIFGGVGHGYTSGVLQEYYNEKHKEFSVGFIRGAQLESILRSLLFLSEIKVGNKRFKDMTTTELTAVSINRFIVPVVKEERTLKTVLNYWSTYSQLGKFCVGNGYLMENLFAATKPKQGGKLSNEKTNLDHLNKETINKIIDQLPISDRHYKRCNWKLAVMFASQSGLRQGEQRAVTWNDVEFESKIIDVHKSVDRYGNVGETKTKAGKRKFKLNPSLVKAVQEEYIRQGRPNKSDYIFMSSHEGEIHPNQFIKIIRRACKAAGVPPIRWHDLRHYYGSVLLETYSSTPGGEWRITRNMGHTDIRVTSSIYGHVINRHVNDKQDDDTQDRAFN